MEDDVRQRRALRAQQRPDAIVDRPRLGDEGLFPGIRREQPERRVGRLAAEFLVALERAAGLLRQAHLARHEQERPGARRQRVRGNRIVQGGYADGLPFHGPYCRWHGATNCTTLGR